MNTSSARRQEITRQSVKAVSGTNLSRRPIVGGGSGSASGPSAPTPPVVKTLAKTRAPASATHSTGVFVKQQSPQATQGTSTEEEMRSKSQAQSLPAAPAANTAQDIASLGLLEDDETESTSVRPRTAAAEPVEDEPSAEFIDIDFSAFERQAEPQRSNDTHTPTRDLRDLEESGGDSMLARYFRDMALHPVMG